MTPVFSLLHATYGRPEKAVAAMRMAMERAARPEEVEYIFSVNHDDPKKLSCAIPLKTKSWPFSIQIIHGDFAGSAPAWDAAAKASTGRWLLQIQDDLELPLDWDLSLHSAALDYCRKCGGHTPVQSGFIAVSDGFRKDDLCCTAIMNRERYEQCGEFLHAGYRSVFSDDEVTYRALRDMRDGKCSFINARHITFLHRHHYHDKSVPWDGVYERENSAEAYRIGAELFARRNPEAATDGLVTWR